MTESSGPKVISLEEFGTLIRPGETVGLGGMTLYRRPLSLVRAIMRSGPTDLKLVAVTCGFESDLLVGHHQITQVATTYFGLEFLGLAPCFTEQATSRSLLVQEETETSLILGLKAAAMGVTFLPARFGQNTDLLKARPTVRKVSCPYTGDTLIAWPRIEVDTALIHVNACDRNGNAYLSGQVAIDALLAAAAKRVVLSTERIVPSEDLPASGCEILGKTVDYIVPAPFGAHPTSLYPDYRVDVPYLLAYLSQCKDGGFSQFAAERVLIPEQEYRSRFVDEGVLSF